MSTLTGRSRRALCVVDVQNGVVADAWHRDDVIGRIGELTLTARQEGAPVIWVQHCDEELTEGSEDWQIVPALHPGPGEPVISKHYGDAFEDTGLEDVLADLEVDGLVICGAQSDACIISTLFGAMVRGYDTILVADAHTTTDRSELGGASAKKTVQGINLIWSGRTAPGRTAGTALSENVSFTAAPWVR